MRNPIYENELRKQGVKFLYLEKVKLTDIDAKKGLQNQARLLKALDQDLVDAYHVEYKAGNGPQFPPLVVWRASVRGRYTPLDGNQRLAAATKAGIEEHDVYVVDSNDQMVLDRIAWSFNNHVNGARLTYIESMQHAVQFVLKYGVKAEDAAREWGVKAGVVQRKVRVEKVKESIVSAKIKLNPSVTEDVLTELAGLERLGEDIFFPAVKVVNENGLGPRETRELKEKVAKARTHAAKITTIQDYNSSDKVTAKRAETKGGQVKRVSPLPRVKLERILRDGLKVYDSVKDRSGLLPPTKEALKELRSLAADFVHKTINTFGLGTTLQTEPM